MKHFENQCASPSQRYTKHAHFFLNCATLYIIILSSTGLGFVSMQ